MKSKNLAFICSCYPETGGVETVTGLLTDFFLEHGYSVSILALERKHSTVPKDHRHFRQIFEMPGPLNSLMNLSYIDEFIQTRNIACIFNQGVFSQIHLIASKHPQTLFINTLHCNPFWEVQKFMNSKWNSLANEQSNLLKIKTLLRHLLGLIHPNLTHPSIRRYYRKQIESADWYVVLDEAFKKELENKLYRGIPQKKILVIQNPIKLTSQQLPLKKKEVLYIGRLVYEQKRVDRLLRIWASIEEEVPDWTLEIVGDGKDRHYLEGLATSLHLKNICFKGFQEPTSFYRTASILCLTSTYEGSPMVIPEAQSYGVVPIVFGSVESLYSLIDDGMNGLIIPPFQEQAFAEELLKLIRDDKRLKFMSKNALIKVRDLDLETIGSKWLKLIEA